MCVRITCRRHVTTRTAFICLRTHIHAHPVALEFQFIYCGHRPDSVYLAYNVQYLLDALDWWYEKPGLVGLPILQ